MLQAVPYWVIGLHVIIRSSYDSLNRRQLLFQNVAQLKGRPTGHASSILRGSVRYSLGMAFCHGSGEEDYYI